eukprot:2660149-Rhodomonas_salina.2
MKCRKPEHHPFHKLATQFHEIVAPIHRLIFPVYELAIPVHQLTTSLSPAQAAKAHDATPPSLIHDRSGRGDILLWVLKVVLHYNVVPRPELERRIRGIWRGYGEDCGARKLEVTHEVTR